MFSAWGHLVVRYRRTVVIVAALFTLFAGVWGTGVFGQLVDGGFDDPNSESQRALDQLNQTIGRTDADLILLVGSTDRTVDDPSFGADMQAAVTSVLPADTLAAVVSYFNTQSPALVTADRHRTYALLTLQSPGALDNAQIADLRTALTDKGFEAEIGGGIAVFRAISETVGSDIGRAEAISMPILLILLVLIFGGVVAASLPLLVGGIAILGAFTVLRVINQFTDVSIFAVNLVTIMGLGLAIDYGLLIVGRFREELATGYPTAEAVARTVQTAGRTVAISALTVAVSLSGLALFPLTFLRSMAFGGISAVVISAVAAVLVLPAVLAMLGPNVDKWRVRKLRVATAADAHTGFWFKLAQSVMHRPWLYLLVSGTILAVLFIPFFGVKFGGIDQRVLPATAEARLVSDALVADFGADPGHPIIAAVTVDQPVTSAAGREALAGYAAAVQALPGVTGAQVSGATATLGRVDVSFAGEPLGDPAKELVAQIRGLPAPPGVQSALIGGETAMVIDRLDTVGKYLPWMALLIMLSTFVLLFFAFGSVILPVKAILMNILSLGASLGVVTWIFQGGHLSGFLNFTPTGYVEATQPILVLAIVFGLSMDYEVFLLARIREHWDATGDNRLSVATGLQQTGRIISSAALLIIVVIAAFSTSSISFIKLIGIAMLVAIVVDALLVRMLVVPAAMRLMGNLNWYAPAPLARLYRRFGFREELPAGSPGAPPTAPAALPPTPKSIKRPAKSAVAESADPEYRGRHAAPDDAESFFDSPVGAGLRR